jgi:hypothetical protein
MYQVSLSSLPLNLSGCRADHRHDRRFAEGILRIF